MFYDDNIKNYGDINYKINKKYCEKYNLDIILSNEKKYEHRHSAWERLPLLLANIEKYDYLIWIDADAFFYYGSNNICDVINNNKDTNFIFSKDIGNLNNSLNSGFFIVKNTQYSINFLNKWAYDEELYAINPHPYFWDQGVLIDMFTKNILDIKNNSVLFDYGVLQHFYEEEFVHFNNKPYVYHLAGRHGDFRLAESKKYYDKINDI